MLSFVIVTYNSSSTLDRCIASIIDSCKDEYEIVVVDNNSKDKGYLHFLKNKDSVRLIENIDNVGFAKANNIGVLHCKGDAIAFVNPDCILNSEAITYFCNSITHDVIITSNLINDNGIEQKCHYVLPFIKDYIKWLLNLNYRIWFIGALVVMTKATYNKLGGWSEDYFMYAEDLDLCYKANMHDVRLEILRLNVVHVGGTSTSTVWNKIDRLLMVEKATYKFYKKINKRIEYFFLKFLMMSRLAFVDFDSFSMNMKVIKKLFKGC